MIEEIKRLIKYNYRKGSISPPNEVILSNPPDSMIYVVYCMIREFPHDFMDICKQVDKNIESDNYIKSLKDIYEIIWHRENLLYSLLMEFYKKHQE